MVTDRRLEIWVEDALADLASDLRLFTVNLAWAAVWVAAAFIPVQLAISPVQLPTVWRVEATAVGAVILTAIGVIALVHPRREEAKALLADALDWVEDPSLPVPVAVAIHGSAPAPLAGREVLDARDVFAARDVVPVRNAYTARGVVAARDVLPPPEAVPARGLLPARNVIAVPYVDPEDMPVLLGEIWSADDGGWLELPPRDR
jgi:hypothetical protein